MTSPEFNYWIAIAITLKHRETAATKTVNVSNRAVTGETATTYFPILNYVSTLGAVMDKFMPTNFNGSFSIIDSLNSFGVERKFSDLFERYTAVNQQVEVFTAESALDDNDPTFTSVWKGKVTSYERASDQDTPVIIFNVESRLFERRTVGKQIEPTSSPTAPSVNYNKTIPLVFGTRQVRPLQIGVIDDTTSVPYGYASIMDDFDNGGVNHYYVKDIDDVYREVQAAGGVSYEAYSVADSGSTTNKDFTTAPNSESKAAVPITTGSPGHVITHGRVKFHGSSNGAWSGTDSSGNEGIIKFEIYERRPNRARPGIVLAEAEVSKLDYQTSFRGSASFFIEFTFDRFVVMSRRATYFLAISQSVETGESEAHLRVNTASSTMWAQFGTSEDPAKQKWRSRTATNQGIIYDLYGLDLADFTAGAYGNEYEGFGASYMVVAQRAAVTGFDNLDLTELEWILEVDGIRDSNPEQITGTNSLGITGPRWAVELLSWTYNGTTWVDSSLFDFTKYSSTHDMIAQVAHTLRRDLSGQTEGLVGQEELIREICRNTACRVALCNNGKLGLWAWGEEQDISAELGPDDFTLKRWRQADAVQAVNFIRFGYDIQYLNFDALSAVLDGRASNFAAQYELNADTSVLGAELVGSSVDLYGKRQLADQDLAFIGDATTADIYARALLATQKDPAWYVEIEVPFFKYQDIEPLSVITITSPTMPAFFGSSANATLPHYDGEAIDPSGFTLIRAGTYKAQIESRLINFVPGKYPTLTWGCRLLLNYPADPT